jgi:hypothetical protein
MPIYISSALTRPSLSTLSSPPKGLSSVTIDDKLVKNAKIVNKLKIINMYPKANIKNKKVKTLNNSSSLLTNDIYNRFNSINRTLIYSLKKNKKK